MQSLRSTKTKAALLGGGLLLMTMLAPLVAASTESDSANATAASITAGLSTVQIILLAIFGPLIAILLVVAIIKLVMGLVGKVGGSLGSGTKETK